MRNRDGCQSAVDLPESPTAAANTSPLRGNHAVSLYELTVVDDKFVASSAHTSRPFDQSEYSEFKYGRRDIAEMYGELLAELLKPRLKQAQARGEAIVVVGTPYKRLPNAARMLAINAEGHLRQAGLPTSYTYIYQHRLAEGDYSKLSSAERDKRNQEKKRYLDPDDFVGRHVVVIDDVRITGSIERSITAMLADIEVLSVTVVNLVHLDPRLAQAQPYLEDQLNHLVVKDLRDLKRLMDLGDRFKLTTRAVKFILQADLDQVRWLLDQLGTAQIAELYEGIVDEGYDLMPPYHQAFALVSAARFSEGET